MSEHTHTHIKRYVGKQIVLVTIAFHCKDKNNRRKQVSRFGLSWGKVNDDRRVLHQSCLEAINNQINVNNFTLLKLNQNALEMQWNCYFNNCPHTLWTHLFLMLKKGCLSHSAWLERVYKTIKVGIQWSKWSIVITNTNQQICPTNYWKGLTNWLLDETHQHIAVSVTKTFRSFFPVKTIECFITFNLISPSPLQLWVKWKWGLTVYSISCLIVLSCSPQACQSCTF